MSALLEMMRSRFVRVLLVGFLVLLLQVPGCMIGQLAAGRQQSRDAAVAELARTWGGRQDVLGPFLVVPYLVKGKDDKGQPKTWGDWVVVLPEALDVESQPEVEARRRGLFEVPVFRATVRMRGRFRAPYDDVLPHLPEGATVNWAGAHLAVRLSDVHALDRVAPLQWQGKARDFEPGGGAACASGVHAPLGALDPHASAPFAIELELRGSQGLRFAPAGRETTVALRSSWPHPAFQGAWLPRDREVGEGGFTARWQVSSIARGLPAAWSLGGLDDAQLTGTLFGVDLLYPVDPYRMSERSLKYSTLFVGLSFLVLWLFELLTRRPVHLVQYLMFGAALCLFYLLELSLAEHFGFAVAYAVAASAVTLQVSLYARAALGSWRGAWLIFAVVTALYALLYLLLREEDYALLVGSGALFAVLSLVMFLTRRVRWDGSAEAPARQ